MSLYWRMKNIFTGYRRQSIFIDMLFFSTIFVSFANITEAKVWNAYQTPLFSGSYSYVHKIDLPPGTHGMTPPLSLSYNSFLAGNKAGWVGGGWEIPRSYIQTNTDGTFSLFLNGAGHELVYLTAEGRYHTSIESYLKIEKKTGAGNEKGEYWTVFDTNGTEYRFGYNLDSENMLKCSTVTPYVWRWSLDRIKDTNGDCIHFTYAEDPTANDRGAVYLSKIEYNTEKKRLVEFILEDSDRPDMSQIIDEGSEVREARRLAEIRVSVDGQPVKKLVLQYVLNAASNASLLSSITKYGSDGATALPPETFEYTPYTSGTSTDLLTKVTDILGGITTLDYRPSSSAINTSFPENYWLLTFISRSNCMTGPHALSAASTIAYENGAYDLTSEEFRGFGKVTENRPDGSKVVHTFHQDDARKGKEQGAAIFDSLNAPYFETINLWTSSLSDGVYTVRLEKTESYTYDGAIANPKVTRTEYKNFDDYGNVGLKIDYGDIAVTGDETYTTMEFVYNPDLWIVNKVKHSYITVAENGTKLRESWFYYDRAFEIDSPPFAGNLTKEEHWNDNGENVVVSYKYDSFGNMIRKTDPLGNSTEIVYDDTYNTFPELIYNAKNHVITTSFNPAIGKPTSVTDPNGYKTSYSYDVFNRLTKVVKPYDSDAFPTTELQYSINNAPPHVLIVKNRETAGGSTFDSLQVIDGLGKAIQAKSEYYDPAKMVTSDTYYDLMGRVAKQSNEYLTDNSLGYSTPNTSMPSTQTAYDILGRPTLITNPDKTTITTVYDHWTAKITDENQHTKSQTFDSGKRLIAVLENNRDENNNNQIYTTTYKYSPLGELLEIIDHLKNTSTNKYDSLGRKTETNDVDYGQRIYGYDLAGNLTSQTDARGTTIKYQYDALNRQTLIDYPNDKDVQFVYDLYTKGTLSIVYHGIGSDSYEYDQRLRKTQETRKMDGLTWVTKWDYDSMDRVSHQTYPDGEVVLYSYNTQDKLSAILRASQVLLNNMTYNAAGQLTQKSYPNGWNTSFAYDPSNHRLTGISTTNTQSKLQDLTYTYDNSGNVKTLKDAVPSAQAATGRTETFTYDDLYRLTNAHDDLTTGGFDTTYVYNAVGNLLSETDNKTQSVTQYTYGQGTAKPHAVTGKTDKMPNVGSFVIDSGKAYCTRQQVILNNISMGSPSNYMASEDQNFTGASWQAFSTAPVFTLSQGFGNKVVYFKVKNANGESKVKSDDIQYLLDTDADGIPDIYDDDKDGDGIPNSADTEPLNAGNALLDPDGDGLTNLQEYLHGTNPNKADSDGDGWNDYYEIFVSKTNPNLADTDKDGVADPTDPNPNNPYNEGSSASYSVKRWTLNEGGDRRSGTLYAISDKLGSGFSRSPLVDTDGDGIPDAWESSHGLDPTNSADAAKDPDGDGLTNLQEYLHGTNPAAKDSDGDGWNDYKEIFITNTNPNSSDSDGDGIPDAQDPEPNKKSDYGTSANFSIRNGNFNAGGKNRSSATYAVFADRIGGLLKESAIFHKTFSIAPDSVDFHNTVVDQSSTANLVISNQGIENLIIGTISLEGLDKTEFGIKEDSCSGYVISPSVSCTINIAFTPNSPGAKGASLGIRYNDGEIKDASVAVSGIAISPSPQPLTIAKTGTGTGTVTSSPGGINCGSDCSESYDYNTTVNLSASAATGSTFSGWSGGGCSGTGTCTVTMGSAQTVTASFDDTTAPTISIGSPSSTLTRAGPISYTVSYSGADSVTLGSGNITLNKTGTANGTVTVSGTGNSTRTVNISSITGNGTLGISIAAGTASDNAGNTASAAGPSTTFTVDNTAPTLVIGAPSSSVTKAGPITYTVTYTGAHSVTLASGNITLNKTGTANGAVSVSGTGTTTRTVTISSITGDGTLGISIAAGTASDSAGNSASASGPSTTFTVDNTAPTLTIGASSATATKAGPVTYTVTYSGANSITLAPANITLNKTGTANGTVAVSGTGSTTRTVTISSITGDGTLGISIAGGTASDNAGNSTSSAGPSTAFTVDNTAPTIAIGAPYPTLTKAGPVTYTITYSGASSVTLAPANITLNKTGTANGIVAVSGTGTSTRTVTISGITGNGSLGITIGASTASDAIGNSSPAAGPSSTFTVDNTAPTISVSAPSATLTRSGPITYTVNYSGASTVNLTTAKVTLNKTGSASGSVSITGTGNTSRTVTISSITGDGTLGISIASGSATDSLGNSAPAAGPSTIFSVDNTAPSVSIGSPSTTLTKSGPVTYTITYNGADSITLAPGNVTLNKTGTANGSISVTGSGNATRIVSISSITGTGTLGISLKSGTATDAAGNNASGSGASITFTVDNTAPTLVIGSPSAAVTKAGPITYAVNYTGATSVTLTKEDVTLNTSGTATGTVAVSGSVNSMRTVTISEISGDGTLGISIKAGTATDNIGNSALAAGPSTTFKVDNTVPIVSIGSPSVAATRSCPVTYTITYVKADSISLAAKDITLNKTGTASGIVSVTGSGITRTVTVSNISGDGTLGISIAQGTASDSAGNSAAAVGPSVAFVVDHKLPAPCKAVSDLLLLLLAD